MEPRLLFTAVEILRTYHSGVQVQVWTGLAGLG